MNAERKAVWGWALYDWANSAFAVTVMAGFFPLFFKQYWSAGANLNLGAARLGLANSLGSLAAALLAPVLGAIADRSGARKKFLILFAYMGALMTAGLFLVDRGQWGWAVFLYVMGNVGFAGSNTFYDSLLPQVAGPDRLDSVSSLGYALGYLGGGLLFLVNVLMTLHPAWFGLSGAGQAVRVSFVMVGLWWAGFTVFIIIWTPEDRGRTGGVGMAEAVRQGLGQLRRTFIQARRLKAVLLFLAAYWFYIDGVDTIIRMAVDYGLSLGLDSNHLITALLITQFVGFPSALAFGKAAGVWGVRRCIFLAIGVYILVCLYAAAMTSAAEFYFLAVVIGLVQGGVQALSRSYYARLIPKEQAAEFFGFFNLLGKFAAIMGPVLMGGAGLIARGLLAVPGAGPAQTLALERLAARWSITSLILLFLAGAVLLYFVKDKPGEPGARPR